MQLQPNQLLQGRYRIHALIAQGGMGAVYRATDERLGNTVALKQTLVSDPQLRAAFAREARLLASLHHPALPVVSDHFAEGSEQFLVMQYIPGDDLAALLAHRGGPFALAEVLPWADRLLDALDYLHTQRPPIIHRDIKPQNLKLTGRGEIILLDFGLAKGEPAQGATAGGGRSIFGYTPQYAPLEQIQGSGTDPRSDVYATAATLYELLTAEPPPDALTRAAASVRGEPDPLRPAQMLVASLPPALAELLAQAMALNPAQRPPAAAAMRAALHAALSPTASSAQPTLLAPTHVRSSAGGPTIVAPGSSAGMPTLYLADGVPTQDAPPWRATATAGARRNHPIVNLVLAVPFALLTLVVVGTVLWLFVAQPGGVTTPMPTAGGGGGAVEAGDLPGFSRAEPLAQSAVAAIPGWELEVLEVVRGEDAWRRLYEANQFNDPAPEGHGFVLVRMRVRATFGGGQARTIYPEVTGAGRIEYSNSRVPPTPALQTELSGGQVAEGWLAYEIRADETNLLLKVNELIPPAPVAPVFVALEAGAAVQNERELREIDPNRIGADQREPAVLGETAIMEDWELTVREVIRGAAVLPQLAEIYSDFKRPGAGREYALVYVEVRFIGAGGAGDETARVDRSNFKSVSTRAADPQAEAVDHPPVYSLPFPELAYYLYPGGQAAGWVIIDLPVGERDVALVFTGGYDPNSLNTRYFALE